jgi:hypothetical protein
MPSLMKTSTARESHETCFSIEEQLIKAYYLCLILSQGLSPTLCLQSLLCSKQAGTLKVTESRYVAEVIRWERLAAWHIIWQTTQLS